MLSQSTLPIQCVLSEKKCQPEVQDDRYVFKLNLDNIFECMVTKVVDKQQVSYKRQVFLTTKFGSACDCFPPLFEHSIYAGDGEKPLFSSVFAKCENREKPKKLKN